MRKAKIVEFLMQSVTEQIEINHDILQLIRKLNNRLVKLEGSTPIINIPGPIINIPRVTCTPEGNIGIGTAPEIKEAHEETNDN